MKTIRLLIILFVGLGSVSAALAGDDSRRQRFATSLSGYNEVHFIAAPTPAQAHIHFGQHHTVGGIVVWLCQGTLLAPESVRALTPNCPQEGTVTGTITPAQVLEAVGQGILDGEFGELVAAIRAGRTYANVHSTTFPPGEIRGQIRHDRGHKP